MSTEDKKIDYDGLFHKIIEDVTRKVVRYTKKQFVKNGMALEAVPFASHNLFVMLATSTQEIIDDNIKKSPAYKEFKQKHKDDKKTFNN